jgi:hypothetical protein
MVMTALWHLSNILTEYIGKSDRSAGVNSKAVVTWGDDEGMITTLRPRHWKNDLMVDG